MTRPMTSSESKAVAVDKLKSRAIHGVAQGVGISAGVATSEIVLTTAATAAEATFAVVETVAVVPTILTVAAMGGIVWLTWKGCKYLSK